MSQPCGCCEGIEIVTPFQKFNPPGLDAIVYRAGTHAAFLETMKARLSDPGSYLFTLRDLQDPIRLATKLKVAQDAVSTYLRGQLRSYTRDLLDAYDDESVPPESLQKALLNDLNRVLEAGSLYDAPLFAQVKLTQEVLQLIREEPQGKQLVHLNRLLLEEAYPQEIVRSRRVHPLQRLTTRDSTDPSIALLDAWATVADVLTFYQERVANEGYLRTATERRSVLELARLVGYALRPGVAAGVYLAFTLENGYSLEVPVGTRAQSLPGPGELPQSFETSEKLAARDVWNNLKPRLTRPQIITLRSDLETDAATRKTLYLLGTTTNLETNDALLFVFGDGRGQQVLRFIQTVEPETAENRTRVTLQAPDLTASLTEVRTWLAGAISDATTLFRRSALAGQVQSILQQLNDGLRPGISDAATVHLLQQSLSGLRDKHEVAIKRRYTRLEPWIGGLIDEIKGVLASRAFEPVASSSRGAASFVLTGKVTEASALGILGTLLGPLSIPPSLQPANTFELVRDVGTSFAAQADTLPRLVATLRPEVKETLYTAWANVPRAAGPVEVYALRLKAPLFGNNAPKKIKRINRDTGEIEQVENWPVVEVGRTGPSGTLEATPARIKHEDPAVLNLDASYDKILSGTWIAVQTSPTRLTRQNLVFAKSNSVSASVSRAEYGITGKTTRIDIAPARWITADLDAIDPLPDSDFEAIRQTIVYAQTEPLALAEEPVDDDIQGDTIELEALYDGLDSGRWLIVSGERTDIDGVTGVSASELVMLSGVKQGSHPQSCSEFPRGITPFKRIFYVTQANANGDKLVVGEPSEPVPAILQKVPAPRFPNQQYCDPLALAAGRQYANAYVPSTAERRGDFSPFEGLLIDPASGAPGQPFPGGIIPTNRMNSVYAWRISGSRDRTHTALLLANKLAYRYDPRTVTIYGNVAPATHGETRSEVLGSGDGSKALQHFPLRQAPLTHLSAATPAGAASTLQVRVNDVLWSEAGRLDELNATGRGFITRTGDDDKTTVIFGNGENGARLPTGAENVRCVYRTGIGKPGNVKARQISLLATRPLGVKTVINPLRASGGADRDSRDQARRNAPLAVTALDRLVSVKDYADFARTYAGIGKAMSVRISDGFRELVHLTIAGAGDIPIDENSDLFKNLIQALSEFGDPNEPVRLAVRELLLLVIGARVRVLPEYEWQTVAANIRVALFNVFSFEGRELGQDATLSEVISAIQAVQGVAFADVDVLDSVSQGITTSESAGLAGSLGLRNRIEARPARPESRPAAGRILPAQLAILSPDVPDTLILSEITG